MRPAGRPATSRWRRVSLGRSRPRSPAAGDASPLRSPRAASGRNTPRPPRVPPSIHPSTMCARGWARRERLRGLGRLAGGLLAAPWSAGCGGRPPEHSPWRRPRAPAAGAGRHAVLGLGGERDGVLYVPPGATRGAALILMLHGAGGSGRRRTRCWPAAADATGCACSRRTAGAAPGTPLTGGFGPDVRFIERALTSAFARRSLDAGRVAVAGFSDGATYALALGRANGEADLPCAGLLAGLSWCRPRTAPGVPGSMCPTGGTTRSCRSTPAAECSFRCFRRDGYDVLFREFDGRHEVPPAVAREAVDWFLASSPPRATTLPQ